jgi:hypothetical protein
MHHFIHWIKNIADRESLFLFGGTLTFGTVTHITANEVTLFFTVAVGTTATIYNIIKTKITLDKERRRRKGQQTPEDLAEDDD